jgi:hypothetical protein
MGFDARLQLMEQGPDRQFAFQGAKRSFGFGQLHVLRPEFFGAAGLRISVSHSNVEAVKRYIAGQEEHHRKMSFQDELLSFLKKNGIEFDERYIWK